MTANLWNLKLINRDRFNYQDTKLEIAKILNISTERIQNIEFWQYQILVTIEGVGGKFFSYRYLSPWIQQVMVTIRECEDLDQLQALGEILKVETESYRQYYQQQELAHLRLLWKEKKKQLEALQPLKEKQQAAKQWVSTWKQFLNYCENREVLGYLIREIQRQSQRYLDFPEMVQKIEQLWEQRCQEILSLRN